MQHNPLVRSLDEVRGFLGIALLWLAATLLDGVAHCEMTGEAADER